MKKRIGWLIGFWFGSSVYAVITALSCHYNWNWWIPFLTGAAWGITMVIGVSHLSND